jgi:hypothetical protein
VVPGVPLEPALPYTKSYCPIPPNYTAFLPVPPPLQSVPGITLMLYQKPTAGVEGQGKKGGLEGGRYSQGVDAELENKKDTVPCDYTLHFPPPFTNRKNNHSPHSASASGVLGVDMVASGAK